MKNTKIQKMQPKEVLLTDEFAQKLGYKDLESFVYHRDREDNIIQMFQRKVKELQAHIKILES